MKRYIPFVLTNVHYNDAEKYVRQLKYTFGSNNPKGKYLYAFGLVGPMMLTQSKKEIQACIKTGFDLAEKYDIPVWFQMDDITSNKTSYEYDCPERFWENPNMIEYYDFPTGTDSDRPAKFWYNWGQWTYSPAFPCLNSPQFLEFVKGKMCEGILPTLSDRYNKLKEEGREWLFAGICTGWETLIPDYRPHKGVCNIDPDAPPTAHGYTMTSEEMAQVGYAALQNLGFTRKLLNEQARELSLDVEELTRRLLSEVQREYSCILSKYIFDVGIPRTKNFTHIVSLASVTTSDSTTVPEIKTAVNPYSTPGFTMSPVTCPYDIPKLRRLIYENDGSQDFFGNVEGYCAGVKDSTEDAAAYFQNMWDGGAIVVTVFGYTDSNAGLFYVPKEADNPFNQIVYQYINQR
jgi:hypothetical protein